MEVDAPSHWKQARRWVGRLASLFLFLVSIQLLKSSIGELAPALHTVLPHFIRDDLSALGASWGAAYLFLNGSVVAALALTLFKEGLLLPAQLLLMVFGSRLGAAGIVLLVGMFDFFHQSKLTVRKASELGIIAFLVTHTIGIPAAVVGYAWLFMGPLGSLSQGPGEAVSRLQMPTVIEWVAEALLSATGPVVGLLAAIGLLMMSLHLFHALVEGIDFERLRARYERFLHSRWVAFGIGLVLTALTTSIAFSIGVIVPVYNRGFIHRNEVIPYILGANIGTLLDTMIISLFIERMGVVEIVLITMGATALVTLSALLIFGLYRSTIEGLLDRILTGRYTFIAFLVSLGLVPLFLVVLGWGLG